jgi:hypothetical protein
VSKPFAVGAYANQRLNLAAKGKAHGRDAKTSNRTRYVVSPFMCSSTFDLGNSAVRHYRGASENVAMAEL